MFKKFFMTMAMALTLVMGSLSVANAESGFYAEPKMGVGVMIVDEASNSKSFFNYGLAVGYDFYKQYALPVRTEVEYTGTAFEKYKTNATKLGFNYDALVLNAYYDFRDVASVVPYVGAGIGEVWTTTKVGKTEHIKAGFAANVGGGVYKEFGTWAVDASLKYVWMGNAKPMVTTVHSRGVNAQFGLRYSF